MDNENIEIRLDLLLRNRILDIGENKQTYTGTPQELKEELIKLFDSENDSYKASLTKAVEGMKANLVTDNNNETGKPGICNPRCHDSGKEDALDRVLTLISSQQ